MDHHLEFLYFTRKRTDQYVGFHKHGCWELVYYIQGTGKTVMAEAEKAYSSGTFTLIPPHCLHDEDHEEDTDVLYIGFRPGSRFTLESGLYRDDIQQSICQLLKKMKEELLEQRKNYRLKADFLLGELLIELERLWVKEKKHSLSFSYLDGYIQEHCSQPMDLQALARMSGYSYHRFRHLFREWSGLSPSRYILNKRLDYARRCLEQSTLSVSEIAQECGFSNESQFVMMFKRDMGCTPGTYRKSRLGSAKAVK